MPSASPYIDRKTTVPSARRTRDWDCVPAQIRERAYFMAGVTDARILSEFRSCVDSITRGEMSSREARRHLREYLKEIGYEPDNPEDVGTIKDLGTTRRMRVALDTNTKLANGWAQHQEDLRDHRNPAQELYRQSGRREPRDWQARWNEAAKAVDYEGVATDGRMIALATSPIWRVLSRFDLPYPPFDFNSGMGTRPIDRDTARAAGCYGAPDAHEPSPDEQDATAEQEASRSLNEGLEVKTQVDSKLEGELQKALQGIAIVEDGMARSLDINGTTPMNPEDAGRILGATMPKGVPNLQADAYRMHTQDPEAFAAEGPLAAQNLQNLINRIKKTVSRGGKANAVGRAIPCDSNAHLASVTGHLEGSGVYSPLPGRVAESWAAASAVGSYATGKHNVILVAKRYKSRVKADSLDKALGLMKQRGHSLFSSSVKWRVVRKISDTPNANGGRDVTYEVEEVQP